MKDNRGTRGGGSTPAERAITKTRQRAGKILYKKEGR
jgi:hypothetical protein